jgi:hypothetical protein
LFEGSGGVGKEVVDKIGGAERGAKEAGALGDLGAGTLKFGDGEVEVMELSGGEVGGGGGGGGGEDFGLGAVLRRMPSGGPSSLKSWKKGERSLCVWKRKVSSMKEAVADCEPRPSSPGSLAVS